MAQYKEPLLGAVGGTQFCYALVSACKENLFYYLFFYLSYLSF